jgi:hypothetical protein
LIRLGDVFAYVAAPASPRTAAQVASAEVPTGPVLSASVIWARRRKGWLIHETTLYWSSVRDDFEAQLPRGV